MTAAAQPERLVSCAPRVGVLFMSERVVGCDAAVRCMSYLITPTIADTNSTATKAIVTRSSSGKFCAIEHHPARLKLYHFPNRRFRC
jgi:hypothetical protein